MVTRAPRGASRAGTGARHYRAEALDEERVEVGHTGSLGGGPANLTDVWSDRGARRRAGSARGVVGSLSGKRILAGKVGSAAWAGSSAVSISSSGEGAGWGGGGTEVGTGRATQSRYRAEWGSPQFGHFAGETSQQASTGRWLPSFGHTGLGHLCSAFLWCKEQKGHVGWSWVHRWATCPNWQQLSHWENLLAGTIGVTFLGPEKR